jgi:hypothetical protein
MILGSLSMLCYNTLIRSSIVLRYCVHSCLSGNKLPLVNRAIHSLFLNNLAYLLSPITMLEEFLYGIMTVGDGSLFL